MLFWAVVGDATRRVPRHVQGSECVLSDGELVVVAEGVFDDEVVVWEWKAPLCGHVVV